MFVHIGTCCEKLTFHKPNKSWKAWKTSAAPMDRQTPRYKKDVAQEDLPKKVEKPTLRVCQIDNQKLLLPRDVRQMFLQDPVWAPEWRELLVKFDQQWSTNGVAADGPVTSNPAPSNDVAKAEGTAEGEVKSEGFDWDAVFPGEPTSLDKLQAKHGAENLTEMPGIQNTTFLVGPGPTLYLLAKEVTILKPWEAPLIMHGAGVWLIGDKARKFSASSPNKGIPCSWTDDEPLVCIEDLAFKKNLDNANEMMVSVASDRINYNQLVAGQTGPLFSNFLL